MLSLITVKCLIHPVVLDAGSAFPPLQSKKLKFSIAICSNSFILATSYLRCKKVQGSISGRKIKRSTSSAVWNTERKYNSTPHSYLHPPYHVAQLILVLLMRLLGSFVIMYLSALVCLTLGEVWWGLWYLECSYSKQFGKLLSYGRHRFSFCSCLNHQQAH